MDIGSWSWFLGVGVGLIALGFAFVYGTVQWRTARREETPAEKARRETETRKRFSE